MRPPQNFTPDLPNESWVRQVIVGSTLMRRVRVRPTPTQMRHRAKHYMGNPKIPQARHSIARCGNYGVFKPSMKGVAVSAKRGDGAKQGTEEDGGKCVEVHPRGEAHRHVSLLRRTPL
jgi:hypothetical protein